MTTPDDIPEVLQIGPLLASCQAALADTYRVHRLWEAPDKAALLAEVGPRIRAVATDGGSGCPTEVMSALPRLEVISIFGVGYDAVDMKQARNRSIPVTNTPNVLNDAVAELAIGLMLALARRIPQADRHVRDRKWPSGGYPLTPEITGSTLGIVGLGSIGKEIATRAKALKMQIAYHGRNEQPSEPYRYFADLVDLARHSDWLVAIVPGGAETRGVVSRAVLEALGPKGCFVNVARGGVVDQAAMVELLQSGALGGAALDVFDGEPAVPEPLLGMENVVLSPHQGSATHATRNRMGALVIDNLAAHFAGEKLLTPVPNGPGM